MQTEPHRWAAGILAALSLATAAPALTPSAPPNEAARVTTPTAAADDPLDLPFELRSNKLIMQTKVNGNGPYTFVLDTGAPFTVLDWDLANRLNINVTRTGNVGGAGAGTVKLGTATGVRLTVGDLRFQPAHMEIIPLATALGPAEGHQVMGLLGGDILQRFVSEFDFTEKVVRLHPLDFKYEGTGAHVPVRITGHVLARATVKIPGREPITGRFIVDTGARLAVSLSTHVVDDHNLLADDIKHIRTTVGWGIGGPVDHGLTRADSVTIGNVTFDHPTVTLSQDTAGVFAGRGTSGVIGTEVLKRCRLFIDYKREEIILEPVEAAMKKPFPADASGLFIMAGGDDYQTYTIRTVVDASPAAEAGIKPGDELEQFDGERPATLTLEVMRNRLREPGKTFELQIKRGEEHQKIKLTTRTLI